MLIQAPPRSDLHEAYHTQRCPICALLEHSERRYIDITLYEHVTDVRWRAEVRAARGFCMLHTQHVLEIGRSALGASLVAADIIKTLRELLPTTAQDSGGALSRLRAAFGVDSSVARALRPKEACPLCVYLADLGRVYVGALLSDVATDEGRVAYTSSVGLCLPHLLLALQHGGAGLATLLAHQARAWQELEAELNEFVRKNDYRYSGEISGSERDAWRRALLLLAGDE